MVSFTQVYLSIHFTFNIFPVLPFTVGVNFDKSFFFCIIQLHIQLSWHISIRKNPWSCLGFPSTHHSLWGVSCLALTHLFSYFFFFLSAHHLQTFFPEQQELKTDVTFTHRAVCFLEVWRRGTEIIEERGLWWLFAGCRTCFSKAFLKHYSTDYCTMVSTDFWEDREK